MLFRSVARQLCAQGCIPATDSSVLETMATGAHAHVVYCPDADSEELDVAMNVLHLLQAVVGMPPGRRPAIWLVMWRGLDGAMGQHASVWGLVRAVRSEKGTSLRCVCVDAATELAAEDVASMVHVELQGNTAQHAEDEVCVRVGLSSKYYLMWEHTMSVCAGDADERPQARGQTAAH